MSFRRYAPQDPPGSPVADWGTAAGRRRLVGRRIAYNLPGWASVHYGRLEDVSGKNVLISGDWRWAPDLENVHVLDEEPSHE